MEIKIQPRQTGKSYDIAQELKKDENAIVLVITEMVKEYFIKNLGVNENQVMVFSQVLDKSSLRGIPKLKIYIDEIGYCVQDLFHPHQVVWGTHT
ncbi:hypothetical protein KAI04_04305 [Candidatus Pacearchaeota archaeon]|nr:hypothetical protein [Candidatus Pacearchaeota archaeon]